MVHTTTKPFFPSGFGKLSFLLFYRCSRCGFLCYFALLFKVLPRQRKLLQSHKPVMNSQLFARVRKVGIIVVKQSALNATLGDAFSFAFHSRSTANTTILYSLNRSFCSQSGHQLPSRMNSLLIKASKGSSTFETKYLSALPRAPFAFFAIILWAGELRAMCSYRV